MTDALVNQIRDRLENTREQIARAAQAVGRNSTEVRLVVVSKMQPLTKVRAAIQAGAEILGENYAEEAVAKIDAIGDTQAEWHMIGHVQSRKADLIAKKFDWMHSLDSLKLANRLERFCAEAGRTLPVLLEVNLSGEASKFGYPVWDEVDWPFLRDEALQIVSDLPHLRVRGLMTMPPFADDAEASRPFFVKARRLRDYLAQQVPAAGWDMLSMGTSADFTVAVAEGATLVRVGTAIMGPRQAHG
jgi:pyridoxal phosphate enzyme (YggS family)